MSDPKIIQGGMGIGVSTYNLARTVSSLGYVGTVSGTCAELVMVRNLQLGDLKGDWRRALSHFPIPEMAERVLRKYFIENGKSAEAGFSNVPMFTIKPSTPLIELTVCASFAQVWLAKESHNGLVAVNLMTKLPMPMVYNIFGCMLAGVDYILIGAGIPMQIPSVLDSLEKMETAIYQLDVLGAKKGDIYQMVFDPKSIVGDKIKSLKRPKFVPIITSHILAISMLKRLPGKIYGWIIERKDAGGHNAPPRGKVEMGSDGLIIYGPRDEPDLNRIRDLGLPFWLAGSFVSLEGIHNVFESGAVGIQAGTIFALSSESGFNEIYKRELRRLAFRGELKVYDDILASPTGFPFKVAHLPGSLSGDEEYGNRPRVCNIGHLRQLFLEKDGSIGYRCPAEPIDIFISKGGLPDEAIGRKCLCNALAANIDLRQLQARTGYVEKPLITLGRDYEFIRYLMKSEDNSYLAYQAILYLESLFERAK
ncbi:MAG: nitronate monooxygenase [Candidatus Buchananbacteria bacterium]|nr:nitronate monooxygenase [Candidatus Buchananbacteria bacterium]